MREALEGVISHLIHFRRAEHVDGRVVQVAKCDCAEANCFGVKDLSIREDIVVDNQAVNCLIDFISSKAYWDDSGRLDEIKDHVFLDFGISQAKTLIHRH